MYRPKMIPSNYTLQAGAKDWIKIVLTKLHLRRNNENWFQRAGLLYRFVDETIAIT